MYLTNSLYIEMESFIPERKVKRITDFNVFTSFIKDFTT
jgi:hypothetical protein